MKRPLRVGTVLVTEVRSGRLAAGVGVMIRYDGERSASSPHHAPPLKVGPPDFESPALELRDAPVDRPTGSRDVVEIPERHVYLPGSVAADASSTLTSLRADKSTTA